MGSGVVTAPTEANLRAALAGGGMVTFAIDGTISLTNTLVVTNATTLDSLGHAVTLSGGGSVQVLVVLGNASLVLKGLTIADGYLYNSDGAGLVNWGDATIVDCTFSNNVTQAPTLSFAGGGGAISHHGSALRVNGSTFVQNVSTYFGGALDCGRWNTLGANGQVGITNCTFYANSAGAVSLGGRLNQPVVLVNCTFAWNTNGGISFFTMLPSIVPKVINSVFAYTMNGGNAVAVADGGHNISSDNSTVFTVTTSRTNADPLLGPFANWGGPSWTVPLLPSSPARYYIDDNSAPATDQRGVARPPAENAAAGAFEGEVDPNYSHSVRFLSTDYGVNQAPGMALVEVERMGSSDGTVSVNFSAQAGTATAGVDFIATNLVLTWTNNDLATKSVPVVVLAGQPAGGDKTVLLTLHDPAGAGLSTPSAATLTLFQSVPSQTLTNFTDAGLRTAVTNGGRILFANDGTLTLTSTLYITTATTLEANGHQVVLSGNAACRLFYVAPGGVLTLNDLTITKGAAAGASGTGTNVNGEPAYGGAAFVAQGVLNVIGCHVWTNVANGGVGGPGITTGGDALGGAFYVHGGTLNLTNSDLVGNLAAGGAGGIQNPGNSQPTGNGGRAFGGAVFNAYGTLSLSTDLFLANQAVGGKAGLDASFGVSQASGDAQGGALCQAGGTGQISACDFEANAVSSLRPPGTISGSGGNVRGGAVCNSNGWLSIEACTFMNNMALGGNGVHHDAPGNGLGGAIANSDQMQLDTCWLANNTVSGGAASTAASMAIGGAVYNEGTLGATCSLVASNAASNIGLGYSTAEGGAVANLGACGLTNVTLYANLAAGGQKGSQILGLGGGLFNSVGTATLVNCTIAGNLAGSLPHAPGPGGGVLNSNGSVFLLNALLADNHLGSNACGQITDGGHNLSSDGSCNFTAPGSLNRANPVLGPLADYGGATSTMPLLAGSPAIDGGAATGAPASDQRGHARPYGTAPDIGAFESSPPYMIRGSVSGFSLKNEVTVAAGGVSQLTTNGSYQLAGLAPGFYSVTPTHPDYLFIPASQNLTVGPDQLGVNFHAYHWNMISVEGISNRMVQVVVASTNSGTTRLLSSSNLRDWSPCLTNQLGADHTARYALPTTSPVLFYRAVTP